MMTKNNARISFAGAIGLMLALGGSAWAQGVGNPGSLPSQINMNTTITGWDVGAVGTPIPVVLNPAGPVWRKKLADPIGNPFGPPGIVLNPGQPYHLDEHLVIDPTSPPWTDWHEDILTPGWTWSPVTTFLANGLPTPGLSINNSGTSLSYFFNSLPAGTLIDIHKELIYQSIPGVPFFQGFINVQEYPTPEPTSLILGLASFVFLKRPRHGSLNLV